MMIAEVYCLLAFIEAIIMKDETYFVLFALHSYTRISCFLDDFGILPTRFICFICLSPETTRNVLTYSYV